MRSDLRPCLFKTLLQEHDRDILPNRVEEEVRRKGRKELYEAMAGREGGEREGRLEAYWTSRREEM